jgi:hypothetical protein
MVYNSKKIINWIFLDTWIHVLVGDYTDTENNNPHWGGIS